MNFAAASCFTIALLLAIWCAMTWRGFSRAWLPAELRNARLVMIEEDLTARGSMTVVGRPDRVYRLQNGEHVVLELKNRDRVVAYSTDVAEVSLRAWLLRRNGKVTAEYGFVAVNSRTTGRRTAIRVDLLSDERCESLIARHRAVMDGTVMPRASRGRKCDSCGHRRRCFEQGTTRLRITTNHRET